MHTVIKTLVATSLLLSTLTSFVAAGPLARDLERRQTGASSNVPTATGISDISSFTEVPPTGTMSIPESGSPTDGAVVTSTITTLIPPEMSSTGGSVPTDTMSNTMSFPTPPVSSAKPPPPNTMTGIETPATTLSDSSVPTPTSPVGSSGGGVPTATSTSISETTSL